MANPVVIELKRLDTALTKTELIYHLETEHDGALADETSVTRLTKATLINLHRLIHLGLGR